MTRSQLVFTVKAGKRQALLDELDRLQVFVAVREQPGFLAAAVLVADEHPDRVLLEGSWSSPAHFERWRSSPARKELLDRLRHLLSADPEVTVYHVVDAVS